MLSLPRIALKALAGLVQQFRRQGKVTLCRSDMNMAEVSCQLRQKALHVCPLAIPGDQAMNCKGMPQVMQSRLVTTSVLAQYACADTQSAEDVFRCVTRHRSSGAGRKQRSIQLSGVLLCALGHIPPNSAGEVRTHGYQPCLVEFAFANREDTGGQIHVAQPEGKRLADAQTRSVQQAG